MPWTTECPTMCEVCAVIRSLRAEGCNEAEIYSMSNVYGTTFMSDSKVWQWCRNFEAGRTDINDAGR